MLDFARQLLLIVLITSGPILPGFLLFLAAKRHWLKSPRSSPLTRDMLRPPGHSLRVMLSDTYTEIIPNLILLMGFSPLVVFVLLARLYVSRTEVSTFDISLGLFLIVVGFVVLYRRIERNARDLLKYSLGLDGEMAVAEELNQLMLVGYRVFHDFPFDYGNIDHVVVGVSGVYAVETKMRGKPKKGAEDSSKLVVHGDSNELEFPDGRFPIPLAQLKTQSDWLSKYLTSATGFEVEVQSLLTFPGWFIERHGGGMSFSVFSPRNPTQYFSSRDRKLSPSEVQRIAHQLEQRCRDVKPGMKQDA